MATKEAARSAIKTEEWATPTGAARIHSIPCSSVWGAVKRGTIKSVKLADSTVIVNLKSTKEYVEKGYRSYQRIGDVVKKHRIVGGEAVHAVSAERAKNGGRSLCGYQGDWDKSSTRSPLTCKRCIAKSENKQVK